MPYYQDNHIRIFNKDCRHMDELPDESVQCVVTSPPYFGLRKYSGAQELIWGGDKDCEHKWVDEIKPDDAGQSHYTGRIRWQHIAKEAQEKGVPVREIDPSAWAKGGFKTGFCSLCGAWKGAYGLEPTPEMYIEHTIEILREIRRVLRKDGVVFWNIGDSYAGSGSPGGDFRDGKGGRATPEEGYKATQEEIDNYPGNHPDPGYSRTLGWKPTCTCNAPRAPSLVLDPMMGAGTTLLVAKKLNRQAVGYEISEEYCWLALDRCLQQVLL